MAAARVAGRDAGDLERNNCGIEQRHNPAHRAHEALRLACAPVHVLGPVEGEHFFGQFGGQDLGGGAARALDRRADVFALGRRDLFESLDRRRRPSSRRPAAAGVGAPSLNATFHDGPVSCSSVSAWLGEHALDQHGQPARRGVGGDLRAVVEQPLAGEQIA